MRQVRIAAMALLLVLFGGAAGVAKSVSEGELDKVVSGYFAGDGPGAAVLVMKEGKALLRKGYGMADLELGVKIQPDHVFRIGSVTKQFTSVAILQLVEQGKLRLDDPITRFFPDYPTQGKTITVEHLLTHTSGIQSYTDRPGFRATMRNDVTPLQLIDTFKNDPMKFAPGERYAYNNSAYVILGAIIEQLTGKSYAEYLEANVFPRAGLTQTYYRDAARIIPKRIDGYGSAGGKVVNARYVSMTIPYAAGSILSTVDDLAKWTEAVTSGKVVGLELLQRAWTPYKLTNGESTGYGYGWSLNPLFGSRVIAHGGGIMGFSAHALWMPDEKVFVAVLANSDDAPVSTSFLARRLASYAIGKPWNPVEVSLTGEQLREYEAIYRAGEKETLTIGIQDGRLYSQVSGGPRTPIFASGRDQFFFKDSFNTMTFERGADGKIAALVMNADGKPRRATRTEEKPVQRVAVAIAPEKLDRYVGSYRISPEMTVAILRRGDKLYAQPRGAREQPLFAESETKWFLEAVDAQLTFDLDAAGKVTALTLQMNGRTMKGERVGE